MVARGAAVYAKSVERIGADANNCSLKRVRLWIEIKKAQLATTTVPSVIRKVTRQIECLEGMEAALILLVDEAKSYAAR